MHYLAIHGDGFHLPMRKMQNGTTRRFVYSATLHAHKPVFHDVHTADTVLAAQLIELPHHPEWIQSLAVHSDTVSLIELEMHILGFIRRILGRHRQLEHLLVLWRKGIKPRVLQNPRLI